MTLHRPYPMMGLGTHCGLCGRLILWDKRRSEWQHARRTS